MRIGIVQFGDYRDAFRRFEGGGAETYYAQRYSVDFVADLARRAGFVGVLAILGERHEEQLAPNLFSASLGGFSGRIDERGAYDVLARWAITHLILQTPAPQVIKWALRRSIPILPILADSWRLRGVRTRLAAFRLARILNRDAIAVVANHNIPACLSLAGIGVAPEKIYPWDWPHALSPDQFPAKRLSDEKPHLLYVGAMIEAKGAGDCIEAARLLADRAVDFQMTLIGRGEFEEPGRRRIAELGLADRVVMAGRKPHDAVVAALSQATLSLVASRHDYAEGLPMTIYESLATRTPLILSDHPMFRRFFSATTAAKMVPQRSPAAIADGVATFLSDATGYAQASDTTADLWRRIKGDLVWGRLVEAWLENPAAPNLPGCSLPERLAAQSSEAS